MSTQNQGRNRLLAALREHRDRGINSRVSAGLIGVVSQVDPISAQIPELGITIDSDNLLIGQSVAQYDSDYGIDVGDSLAIMPTASGDFIAVAVMTGAEATDRGASFFAGTTAPDDGTGKKGDFYLNTATSRIYGPKTSDDTGWGSGTSLVGATGPAGATGPTGPTGSTGPAGATGAGLDIGALMTFAGPANPNAAVWQACDGSSLLRAGAFAALFTALTQTFAAVTISIASPGVITTGAAHGLAIGDSIMFSTTGALPTGLTAGAQYYVMTVPTGTTFTVGTTKANTVTGIPTVTTAVNTTGTQSGVHAALWAPHGAVDATHFNAPDLRGKVAVGAGTAGGFTSARHLAATGGEETHPLTTGELPAHDHSVTPGQTGGESAAHTHSIPQVMGIGGHFVDAGSFYGLTEVVATGNTGTESANHTHGLATVGSGTAHNTMSPFLALPVYVRYA